MVDISKIDSYVSTPYGFRNLATGKYASKAELAAKRAGKLPVPISHYEKDLSQIIGETGKKASKLKKFGKFGLIALGAAALVAGGIYLYNRYTKNKQTPTPVAKPAAKPTPMPVSKPTQKPVPKPVPAAEYHTVKKGDNLWNISKQYLENKHKDDPSYKVTNKEIAEKTEELIKNNKKHYRQPFPSDSKKRVVLIYEGEKIKLN